MAVAHGRAALHVPADLLRRADVVQRPGQPAVLRVRRVHAGQLADPCAAERHVRARWSTSLQIGFLATLGATLLGTLVAFALVRHRFRGRAATSLLIFLPMATPEVVMGSSLLALFTSAGLSGSLGFWSILVAHIMFCLSFVVVTVKARLAGLDPSTGAGGDGPLRQRVADVLADHLPAGVPRHPGGGAAELLAVLRRLHRHELQPRQHDHLPDVRVGRPRSAASRRRST